MSFSLQKYRAHNAIELSHCNADDLSGLPKTKEKREMLLHKKGLQLAELQDLFYANQNHKMLIILQGMDTSGKDGTIRHVFHAVDPLGVRSKSFKVPTVNEQAYDFLWRIHHQVPQQGEIVIFNRSHYEDILVPAIKGGLSRTTVLQRMDHIIQFEKMLAETGTIILKFFLHISKEEQRKRLQKRVDNEKKHWKFNLSDLEDRKLWDAFQKQYEEIIQKTDQDIAPWYVIPANSKSGRNVIIMRIVLEYLKALNLTYPVVDNSAWRDITVE